MEQLTAMDNLFLRMESKRTPTHVSGLTFVDPSSAPNGWGIDQVRQLLIDRMHLVPPLRRRLVYVPGNLDHPYWIEDPDFDLDYHLRHRALPKPGNYQQLEDLVCQIFMRTLDRTRPLWELYVIEGLENGQACIFTKMHHACIDGMSGQEIIGNLLDLTPEVRQVPLPAKPWKPEDEPQGQELLKRAFRNLTTMPRRAIELLPQLGGAAVNISKMLLQEKSSMPDAPFLAPRSIFNQPATTQRRYAFGSVDLETMKALKQAYQCSLNDMVMAVCATALREYCDKKGMLPDQPMLAAIPISVRTEATKNALGNFVSTMYCSLATDVSDPKERLEEIVKSSVRGKEGHNAIGATTLMDWSQFAAPAVLGLASRTLQGLGLDNRTRPPFNVAISNVPGPRVPLYWAGAKVHAIFPFSVTLENMGLNITLQSYLNHIDFGITAYKGTVSDPWLILDLLADAIDTYAEAAGLSAKSGLVRGLPPELK